MLGLGLVAGAYVKELTRRVGGYAVTRAYSATRMPNLLVMPGSRRTAGPRTAFLAGSGNDAVRLKPAFTAGIT